MAVTTDRLLAGIKRRAVIPTNQVLFDDDDILDFIDDVIKVHVVPLVDSVNGEYFVTSSLTALVASQSNYKIPSRAIGRTIRDLKLEDTTSGSVRNCPYIEPEDIHLHNNTALNFGHYFKGDEIYLVPDVGSTLTATESLQIWYKLRPSAVVKLTKAAKVSSVSIPEDLTDPGTVVVESVGDVVTSSVIDFIQGTSGNGILGMDKTCTNVAGTTLTFLGSDIPTGLAAGDYISLAGTAPVVTMIPDECSPWIERLTAQEILLSIGDDIGADKLSPGLAIEKRNLLSLLEPRNEGEPKIIMNRSSLARGGKFQHGRWLYGGI